MHRGGEKVVRNGQWVSQDLLVKLKSFDRLALFFFSSPYFYDYPRFTIRYNSSQEFHPSSIHKLDNTRDKQYPLPPPLQNKNILANLPSGFSTLV